jgi:hypothetical protein
MSTHSLRRQTFDSAFSPPWRPLPPREVVPKDAPADCVGTPGTIRWPKRSWPNSISSCRANFCDVADQKTGPRAHCYVCGRHLTDPASISCGIGSECWQDVLS